MFMSCHFPLQPRHVDGVLYVDFYGISTVNSVMVRLCKWSLLGLISYNLVGSVTQDPYLARQLSVFSPRGSHQRVNLCACSLSQMVMQEDTKIYPGSGKRRPYVQWGREVCIILHLSACTGANTRVYEPGRSMETSLRVCVVLRDGLSIPGSPLL